MFGPIVLLGIGELTQVMHKILVYSFFLSITLRVVSSAKRQKNFKLIHESLPKKRDELSTTIQDNVSRSAIVKNKCLRKREAVSTAVISKVHGANIACF